MRPNDKELATMEEIRVIPTDEAGWYWARVKDDDEVRRAAGTFDDRATCITAARAEGGAEPITITRGDGASETLTTAPLCRIVLLRADGSEVGELDAAPGDGDIVHRITLAPAVEANEGEEVEVNHG